MGLHEVIQGENKEREKTGAELSSDVHQFANFAGTSWALELPGFPAIFI